VNKEPWLHAAEIFDTWRTVPRIVLFLYVWYVASVTFFLLHWYAKLPALERTTEVSAVVGLVITAVTGFGPLIFNFYMQNGRDWSRGTSMSTRTTTIQRDSHDHDRQRPTPDEPAPLASATVNVIKPER
jgi:hypothetical protein